MAVQLLSNVRDLPHVASSVAAVVGTEYGPTDDLVTVMVISVDKVTLGGFNVSDSQMQSNKCLP
jgi:hypothetical protein